MARNVTGFTLGLLAALVSAGCGSAKDRGPKKETIQPLLQQEAQSLKRDGEKGDPKLGVAATWIIEGVDITEQPGNADAPWLGTIRFKIESTMKDELGAVQTQSFQKKFVYVWNVTLSRWLIQYTPPSPTAKKS
jgi:hypothetical protein